MAKPRTWLGWAIVTAAIVAIGLTRGYFSMAPVFAWAVVLFLCGWWLFRQFLHALWAFMGKRAQKG